MAQSMYTRLNRQQTSWVTPARFALVMRYITISSLLAICIACTKKPSAAPSGWLLNNQPLTSTQNAALPAGSTLHLPEKFTLEAATDSVIRVTQNKQNDTLIDLLYGTAVIAHHDVKFSAVLQLGAHKIKLAGARLLVQNRMSGIRIAVVEGAGEQQNKNSGVKLSSSAENLLEITAAALTAKRVPINDFGRYFPEISNFRRLLASR